MKLFEAFNFGDNFMCRHAYRAYTVDPPLVFGTDFQKTMLLPLNRVGFITLQRKYILFSL